MQELTEEEADTGVVISRAERLRIPRMLDSGRLAKLKAFKSRITDWAQPSPQVYDEPIIVTLRVKRELKTNGTIEYPVERTFDHFHPDVIRFEELIDRKKAAGYVVSVKDAVWAYMLVFKRGSRHLITGFLRTFPTWSDIKPGTVGQALSRLKSDGWITSETYERMPPTGPITRYPSRFPAPEESPSGGWGRRE